MFFKLKKNEVFLTKLSSDVIERKIKNKKLFSSLLINKSNRVCLAQLNISELQKRKLSVIEKMSVKQARLKIKEIRKKMGGGSSLGLIEQRERES